MTDEELIRMAEKSGLLNPPQDGLDWSAPAHKSDYFQRLERFAVLVAAAEREACAKIAEEHQHDCYYGGADWFEAKRIKAAIQERNKQ